MTEGARGETVARTKIKSLESLVQGFCFVLFAGECGD